MLCLARSPVGRLRGGGAGPRIAHTGSDRIDDMEHPPEQMTTSELSTARDELEHTLATALPPARRKRLQDQLDAVIAEQTERARHQWPH